MINHSDTTHTIYDITASSYWDKASLNQEMDRVFDICIGCRLCFNLCPSFPYLFKTVDEAGEQKRALAVKEEKVAEQVKRKEYLELPEGEHAVEASPEVEFRGEISDLSEAQRRKVVDLCYQCKLCDSNCPYTPEKEHEFQLDFPKLMTRAQAQHTRKHGIKLNDRILSNPTLVGKMGTLTYPLSNWGNKLGIVRWLMEKFSGIASDRTLPRFYSKSFKSWFDQRTEKPVIQSENKVVIFGTCYTNYNEPGLGKAAVEILEHNGVELVIPDQDCCGAPHLSNSDFEGFQQKAEKTVKQFLPWVQKGYKIIVTGPPTCSLTLKQDYSYILEKKSNLAADIQTISENCYDISEYLIYLEKQDQLRTDFKEEIGTVAYHVSCHQKAQRIGFKSRDLLQLIPNTKVKLINRCSGMDGGWGMKAENFEESMKVGERCANDLCAVKADSACSDCSLASLQLTQASKESLLMTHPIIMLHKAYGLDQKTSK